jgi:hypothetical protein
VRRQAMATAVTRQEVNRVLPGALHDGVGWVAEGCACTSRTFDNPGIAYSPLPPNTPMVSARSAPRLRRLGTHMCRRFPVR